METEATIKIWVDGERFVRTAEGNGPVNALDKALRDAIGETYPHLRDIELVNFKVRILDERKGTGAVTRVLLDASDGHDTWGSIGVSENVIEASWDALVDSLEAGMLPGRAERVARRWREPVSGARPHPARPPADRRAREAAGRRDAATRGCWRSGPRLPEFEAALAARLGADARVGGLERHGRAAPRHPRLPGSSEATAWSPPRSASSRRRTACCTRAREPVFCDIDPRTLNIDPGGRRGRGRRPHDRPAAGAHLRLPGRHAGLREAGGRTRPVDRRGRLRGAGRRARRRHGRWARAATSPRSASTPTSSSSTGEGGALVVARRRRSRSAWTASATRAARPTWAGSTTTAWASTTACRTSRARSGLAQLERLDEMLAARARVAALYGEALAGVEGLDLPVPRRRRRPPQLVRLRGAAAARRGSRRHRRAPCASAASTPSPTCRRST